MDQRPPDQKPPDQKPPDQKPLIVQSDRSLLLEVHSPAFEAARDALAPFAELEKSPEHVHTYRISSLSLWNAAAAGLSAASVVETLGQLARYGVPDNVARDVEELMGRFGKLRLVPIEGAAGAGQAEQVRLEVDDPLIAEQLRHQSKLADLLRPDGSGFRVPALARGTLKQRLGRLGYPVDDRLGFASGETLPFALREQTRTDDTPFALRPYQQRAVGAFVAPGVEHGVIVLPCGAGKTLVAMATAAHYSSDTLVLSTGVSALRQWRRELLDKTTLTEEQIGEYSGSKKQVRPVTLTTYNIMSYRRGDQHPHLELFRQRNWGMIVYDEVHLLPAPVFRITAELQARRRLGLTATLVREDALETDVFTLVGPKRYDAPWREIERTGFIAEALCHEVRVSMSTTRKLSYASAESAHEQYRVAAENERKDEVVQQLVQRHAGEGILVIGQYVSQLQRIAKRLGAPMISGKTANNERERLYQAFRAGEERTLVVSKVANFSIDLPDASVCIQVSGTFGSRQEEAQRLGRILRPKDRRAFFYSLVSRDSSEMRFALNRQLFLTEQGYRYYIEDIDDAAAPLPAAPSSSAPLPEAGQPGAGWGKVLPFPQTRGAQ